MSRENTVGPGQEENNPESQIFSEAELKAVQAAFKAVALNPRLYGRKEIHKFAQSDSQIVEVLLSNNNRPMSSNQIFAKFGLYDGDPPLTEYTLGYGAEVRINKFLKKAGLPFRLKFLWQKSPQYSYDNIPVRFVRIESDPTS